MSVSRLEYLFECYINQKCSSQEEEELMQLLAEPENEATVKILIDQVVENTDSDLQMPDDVADSIFKSILEVEKGLAVPVKKEKVIFIHTMRIAAAAIILLLAVATYWFTEKKVYSEGTLVAKKPMQVLPGGVKASLTIANGSIISLDNMQNGTVAKQGNTHIHKKEGSLVYNANASSGVNVPVMYNKLTTARGSQYQLILADGSKVWLNAESSLRFPATFVGSQREVELTGEAYFEVSKNKEKPFMVKVGGMQVEVLGTHFNVNGYTEENDIVTSLLDGSVKVTKGVLKDLLKPGQQAILNKKEEQIKILNADMNDVVAWKNGLFQFKSADISSILRQIERWYDVKIIYAGKIPVRRFEGKISRKAQLSEVLQILELSNIKFTVEGKNIIVN